MKKALVIGAMGQDGSYLCELLLKMNYKVYGITRSKITQSINRLSYLKIENEIEVIELPILTQESVERIIHNIEFDEIYNLSAQSSVGHSFVAPTETLQINVIGTLFWLEAIKNINREIKFYQASSSEMFGNVKPENLPIKENLFFNPASPYGISKAAAHWLTVNYRESYNLFACCGVLFNHESCLRGPNYVVKKVINSAAKIKLGLKKDKIKVGNLDVYRDWGYAPEYVKAMWLMLQNSIPEDFIICSGEVISLRMLVERILAKLDLHFDNIIFIDQNLFRPVDLEKIYGDNSKAKTKLGWNYDLTYEVLLDKLIQDEIKYIEWESDNQIS
jgi:GDPmannose 4,6-dehydratase